MRFELVDRVLELEGERIVTIKNVTSAEEYLGDHFPGFPILPGVLMLEAMVQAARCWLRERAGCEGRWVLAEARNIRYGSMVRPGESLTVNVERLEGSDGRQTFQGRGNVNGGVAVQGRFTLRRMQTTPSGGAK